ncbi:hypothetical protein CUMW_168800 [Citrus unshiu]|uniref:Uncharacterized protein n=1 Tax=Citrus unshiu TaxID=55188 RepID=A0A2H5PUJ6_CITUN|nr:hypothetical protein CUMW_168800 [Citrus unshiu]
MFEAVVAALGLPRALPTNTPSIPCILDNRGRLVYVVDGCWLKFRVCCLKWLALAEHTSEVNVMRPCWIGNLDPFN